MTRRLRWLLVLVVLLGSTTATLANGGSGKSRFGPMPDESLKHDDPSACDEIGIVIPGRQLDQTPTNRNMACDDEGWRSWMVCDSLSHPDSIVCTLWHDNYVLTPAETSLNIAMLPEYGEGGSDFGFLPVQAPGTGVSVPAGSHHQLQWAFVSGGWIDWA